MKFLTNTYDPEQPDAKAKLSLGINQDREQAWQEHKVWLSDKIIGEPRATTTTTVKQLKKMNMVGVYSG